MVETSRNFLIYHQRQAFQAMAGFCLRRCRPLAPEIEKLVWELLVLCADNLNEPSIDTDEEINRIAYDLATIVLKTSDIRTLNQYFRNSLIESILRYLPHDDTIARRMIHFANLVSDAIRDAYTDRLRRLISRHRTSRLADELMLAKRIQERLLPRTIPKIPGFEIAGRVVPAREVGGDYWSCNTMKKME